MPKHQELSTSRFQTGIPQVPTYPRLAPNVQLIGELPDTGFTQRQWLIQRGSKFIQVTELLYRIAERLDGRSTLEEIARGVTDATEWIVEADDVRRVIETKLQPLGLIEGAEAEPRGASQAGGPSPLRVNFKLKLLNPRMIEPLTAALQYLCWTPVVALMLLAIGVAHWWLYAMHDASGIITEALYRPGGLLAVVGILIVAGMFHELGHAAALRYHGGKVRAIGVGLYLIYPVLYTDVTDSYRLRRWARVCTDLGGMYFHLVFTLGLCGLSLAFKNDIPLFAFLIIDLEILRQLLPFVRYDGYWLLADLTGVPDFFTQMQPFARSMRPAQASRGERLPGLKLWVKAVFATYTLITLPLLAGAFLVMLRGLPGFLAKMSAACLTQIYAIPVAWKRGQLEIVVLCGVQIVLLLVPVAGMLYVLSRFSRRLVVPVWKWSKVTPTRRLAGAMGGLACVAVLGTVWAPQFRTWSLEPAPRIAVGKMDTAANKLRQAREAIAKMQTLRAGLEGAIGAEPFSGTLVLKRPNLARVEIIGQKDFKGFVVASDGTTLWTYFPAKNRYVRSVPGREGRNIRAFGADQVERFFRPERIGAEGGSPADAGREIVDGVECDVVSVLSMRPKGATVKYFISTRDRSIRRLVRIASVKGRTDVRWATLKNPQINAVIEASAFGWAAPSSARALELPPGLERALANRR